jgi:hypothetical protein
MEDEEPNITDPSEQNADDTASSTTTCKGFSPQRAIADAIATGWGQTSAEADYHTDLPWDGDDDVARDTDMSKHGANNQSLEERVILKGWRVTATVPTLNEHLFNMQINGTTLYEPFHTSYSNPYTGEEYGGEGNIESQTKEIDSFMKSRDTAQEKQEKEQELSLKISRSRVGQSARPQSEIFQTQNNSRVNEPNPVRVASYYDEREREADELRQALAECRRLGEEEKETEAAKKEFKELMNTKASRNRFMALIRGEEPQGTRKGGQKRATQQDNKDILIEELLRKLNIEGGMTKTVARNDTSVVAHSTPIDSPNNIRGERSHTSVEYNQPPPEASNPPVSQWEKGGGGDRRYTEKEAPERLQSQRATDAQFPDGKVNDKDGVAKKSTNA